MNTIEVASLDKGFPFDGDFLKIYNDNIEQLTAVFKSLYGTKSVILSGMARSTGSSTVTLTKGVCYINGEIAYLDNSIVADKNDGLDFNISIASEDKKKLYKSGDEATAYILKKVSVSRIVNANYNSFERVSPMLQSIADIKEVSSVNTNYKVDTGNPQYTILSADVSYDKDILRTVTVRGSVRIALTGNASDKVWLKIANIGLNPDKEVFFTSNIKENFTIAANYNELFCKSKVDIDGSIYIYINSTSIESVNKPISLEVEFSTTYRHK